MAGREFGPPPSIIKDFEDTWKRWLNLVYRKIYKRDYTLSISVVSGIGDPAVPLDEMTDGLIGFAPVALSLDNRNQRRHFSFTIPDNWVKGSPLTFGITFSNTQTQTGVVIVASQIKLAFTPVLGDLGVNAGIIGQALNSLPTDVDFETLHYSEIVIASSPLMEPAMSMHFTLERDAIGGSDTCVGTVGYKDILLIYNGFLNHE